MTENTELETMIPQLVEITVGGKTITLAPVDMNHLQPAIHAALPILQALKAGARDIERRKSMEPGASFTPTPGALDIEDLKSLDMLSWAIAYAEHGKALAEMVAYLAGVSAAEIGKWKPEEMLNATSAVVRANSDFFVSLARLIWAAPAIAPQTGPNHSSD